MIYFLSDQHGGEAVGEPAVPEANDRNDDGQEDDDIGHGRFLIA